MEFHKLSACEIARGVKEKRFTAEEVARESIERIKTLDKKSARTRRSPRRAEWTKR